MEERRNRRSNVNLQECSLTEREHSAVATGKVVILAVADENQRRVSLIPGASAMIATFGHSVITGYEKQVRFLKN